MQITVGLKQTQRAEELIKAYRFFIGGIMSLDHEGSWVIGVEDQKGGHASSV